MGWNNQTRIYGCMMHLDIKDGKIWIQQNATEMDIACELVEMGAPKSEYYRLLCPKNAPILTSFGVA